MIFKAFVLKYKDKYLKFGSYSSASLKESPLKASLYTRKRDAEARIRDRIWIANAPTNLGSIKIVEITMELTDEQIII